MNADRIEKQIELKAPVTRVWKALAASIASFDTCAELARIQAPTRIVWGDADAIFGRADQETLRSGIAGATLSVYRETGHTPHWEEPERFARELAAFVGDAAPRPLRGSSSTRSAVAS